MAAHAPLILHVPGLTNQGLRSSQLVEFVDIFPTLAEAAGLNPLEPCPQLSNTSLLCTEGIQPVSPAGGPQLLHVEEGRVLAVRAWRLHQHAPAEDHGVQHEDS